MSINNHWDKHGVQLLIVFVKRGMVYEGEGFLA